MDGFKDSTKTRYFSRPNEGFGYSKGGSVKNMAKGGSTDEFSTDPAGNIARYERNANTTDTTSGVSIGGVGTPIRTMTGQTLGRGVGATYSTPIGGVRKAKGGKVTGPKGVAKVGKVMGEFGKGELHSGSSKGPVVKNPKQAVAIALSEGRKASKMSHGGKMGYKRGGSVGDKNMQESTSSRPTGRDIAPVDRLEGRETPRSVTVRSSETTVVPGRNYRGRAGDIPTGAMSDREMDMMPSDLDRVLRILPSSRGEMPMRRGPSGAGFSVQPLVSRLRDALGFKNGGLSTMPRGKKC